VTALTAFVVASIAGMGVGNTAETTLLRAIVAMFVCYFAGLPLGMICDLVVEEHVKEYTHTKPSADVAGSKPQSDESEEPLVV
jgi:ABC-type proline/glycine betaine transport system permease subunit